MECEITKPSSLLSPSPSGNFEKNGILLWVGEFDEEAEPLTEALIERTLSTSEYRRLQQFRDNTASWQFAVGRVLLRNLVSAVVGGDPRDVDIQLASSGKPSIVCSAPLEVSISHSGRHVAVVLSDGRNCGVDIEPLAGGAAELPIHERFFSGAEVSWIREEPEQSRRVNRFLRLWTRKESYLKATGLGLAGLSSEIGFDNFDFGAANVWSQAGSTQYWVHDLGNAEYCLSVCLDRRLDFIEPFTSRIGGLKCPL